MFVGYDAGYWRGLLFAMATGLIASICSFLIHIIHTCVDAGALASAQLEASTLGSTGAPAPQQPLSAPQPPHEQMRLDRAYLETQV